jgi:phage tail-like protein
MGIKGKVRKTALKHRFRVEIDGVEQFKASKLGELKKNTAVVEIWEGGADEAEKVRGRTTYDNVDLTGIAGMNREIYDWAAASFDSYSQSGVSDESYERDFDVVQLDAKGEEMERFRVERAWVPDFSTGDWDNEADEGRAEVATIAYKRWYKV